MHEKNVTEAECLSDPLAQWLISVKVRVLPHVLSFGGETTRTIDPPRALSNLMNF